MQAIDDDALGTLSADRVRHELVLQLQEPSWNALTLLASWGILERLEPRLEGAFHPPLLLRTIDAACGHDLGRHRRAWSMRLAELVRYLGDDAGGWLQWLGFAGADIDLVLAHARMVDVVLREPDRLRSAAASELYLDLGEVRDESIAMALIATGDDESLQMALMRYRAAVASATLHVRGDDVLAAGIPAGRAVGEILGQLFLAKLDGKLPDEAAERAMLADLVKERLQ
jgi:tRNA nucleotidyltransferase/poly(A) polymerase